MFEHDLPALPRPSGEGLQHMALNSASTASKLRRPESLAIRSFPTLSGTTASPVAQPLTSGSLTSDRNAPPTNLINLPPEPTSCGPGSDFIYYRGKTIKRPFVFAIRSFPKGCGSLATATPKQSRSKEAPIVAARGNPKKGSGFDKAREDVVGRSLGEKEKLNDVVRRITEEASGLGNILDNTVVGRSLGENVGEKPIRKSSTGFLKDDKRFCKSASFDSKKDNDIVRRIPEIRSGSGKISENAVVGRSLGEKDVKKGNKKRSLMPDLVEGGRDQNGQSLHVLGDRLVVLALMAAKRCPWMQGKVRGFVASQSSTKKPRVRENGNSAKK